MTVRKYTSKETCAYALGMMDAGAHLNTALCALEHYGVSATFHRNDGSVEDCCTLTSHDNTEGDSFCFECAEATPRRALYLALSCVFVTDEELAEDNPNA